MFNNDLQYFVGLNVGREEDHTSMAILERRPDPASGEGEYTFCVVGLEKCPRGTRYLAVVDWVRERLAKCPAGKISEVTVNATDLDESAVEILRQMGLGAKVNAVVFTDGPMVN